MKTNFFNEDLSGFGQKYQGGLPFPHLVVDDAFDENFLDSVTEEFPDLEVLKKKDNTKTTHNKGHLSNFNEMGPITKEFFQFLNGAFFIEQLEELSGIKGLVPDPHLVGAGLHCTGRGGYLKVHADFNIHPRTLLQRRINVLIYLNKDWVNEWGGALGLWDKEVRNELVTIFPKFNRMVVFDTSSDSFHGHPEPMNCPKNVNRKSVSVYYYSLPEAASIEPHSTLYVPRSDDVFKSTLDEKERKLMKQALKVEKHRRKKKVKNNK